MAIDNLPSSDENRLSGAYIRSLVKQLTSSKPHNTNKNLTNNDVGIVGDDSIPSPCTKGDKLGMAKQNNQHSGGHKKQVRRRLHTSRPYQERLLNMAEARKEIVTALKFHRAAMKQANEKKQPAQPLDQYTQYQHSQSILGVQDHELRKPKNEPSTIFTTNPYYPSYNSRGSNTNSDSYPSHSYPWLNSSSTLIESPTISETLNIPLPNQPLGLNLNLQAFTNLDSTFNTPSSNFKYYSSSSNAVSPSSSFMSNPTDYGEAGPNSSVGPSSGTHGLDHHMHPALDEEEMAEIRSIGEQHQIEWDDTLNLVKSAWWLKFLKTVEFGKDMKGLENDHEYHPFGEFMEFPAWLNANESFLQHHFDDYCSEDYGQDTTLPWMDIGDIDGMDDEWLS